MVNAENGKQEAQKGRLMKGIWGVRAAPRRPSEMMPKEPTFPRPLEAVVLMTLQNAGLLV
jgi:hypothetical protein